MAPIDGPRIPARSRHTRQIVVFLHGYGADGNDLIEIGRQWQTWLPDAEFVAPHAPERCSQAPTGRQWFPLTMRDPGERWSGVTKARPALDAFLDGELARTGLDESKLALVGFSQGTMMALHVGLRRRRAPAAILGFSGMLVGPEHLSEATARSVAQKTRADVLASCRVGEGRRHRRQLSHQMKADAMAGLSSSAWAMTSSAWATSQRPARPPRQMRTASGAAPAATKGSLATTPIPVDRA